MAKSQTTPNFGALLDKSASDVERPKPLPQGSYHCVVKGLPRYDQSSKKKTDFVEFTLVPQTAGEDVDADELAEMGGLANKTIRATYYITEDSLWRLKAFLEHCGIEESGSIRNMIDETPNCEVVAYLRHEASNDGEAVFATLAKTAPVGEED